MRTYDKLIADIHVGQRSSSLRASLTRKLMKQRLHPASFTPST
ncbi:hypothetical protein ACVBEF_15430 [Glaciimonas sp. GG7]